MPRIALLTPIVSPLLLGGYDGPGHSALVIGTKVYSFGDNFGWYVVPAKAYMTENGWRPVLVQHLDGAKVDGGKVKAYVTGSMEYGATYIYDGVCSQQAASAIDAGTIEEFNPSGFNTPYKIAREASSMGYETDRYIVLQTQKVGPKAYHVRNLITAYYGNCPVGMPKFFEWSD